MTTFTAVFIGLVAGIVIQAWRTSIKLKCSIVPVLLKGAGGPPDDDYK